MVDKFISRGLVIIIRMMLEMVENPPELCNNCNIAEAELFQVNGEYCLSCWQEITHSDV